MEVSGAFLIDHSLFWRSGPAKKYSLNHGSLSASFAVMRIVLFGFKRSAISFLAAPDTFLKQSSGNVYLHVKIFFLVTSLWYEAKGYLPESI